MTLLALSHTPVEHKVYLTMLNQASHDRDSCGRFGVRRLMRLTGLRSCSSVRRGCAGLLKKLSIEHLDSGNARSLAYYRVFNPETIFARRIRAGIEPYPMELQKYAMNAVFRLLMKNLLNCQELSRREVVVSLCCIEGLSNAEIANRLQISEQTVKSHLRQIFIKFKIKRRSELISHILARSSDNPP